MVKISIPVRFKLALTKRLVQNDSNMNVKAPALDNIINVLNILVVKFDWNLATVHRKLCCKIMCSASNIDYTQFRPDSIRLYLQKLWRKNYCTNGHFLNAIHSDRSCCFGSETFFFVYWERNAYGDSAITLKKLSSAGMRVILS